MVYTLIIGFVIGFIFGIVVTRHKVRELERLLGWAKELETSNMSNK